VAKALCMRASVNTTLDARAFTHPGDCQYGDCTTCLWIPLPGISTHVCGRHVSLTYAAVSHILCSATAYSMEALTSRVSCRSCSLCEQRCGCMQRMSIETGDVSRNAEEPLSPASTCLLRVIVVVPGKGQYGILVWLNALCA
jgi:hypothetical protein